MQLIDVGLQVHLDSCVAGHLDEGGHEGGYLLGGVRAVSVISSAGRRLVCCSRPPTGTACPATPTDKPLWTASSLTTDQPPATP